MSSSRVIEGLKVSPEGINYDGYILEEQRKDQEGKEHGRLMEHYNHLIFPFYKKKELTESNPVQDFINHYCGAEVEGLEGLFRQISLLRERPIVWVEMGGGRALAMRQIARLPEMRRKVLMFNIDLFDYDLKELSKEEIESGIKYPGLFDSITKPTLIKADSETVKLPKKVDIITSIESIQYLNNPLAAICNWYNQLTDHGLLIIATEGYWSELIRSEGCIYASDPTPIKPLLSILKNEKIAFETGDISLRNFNSRVEFRRLMIEKKPNTKMIINSSIVKICKNPDSAYKITFYEKDKEPIKVREINSEV
jgi:hypothetical protein